MLTVCARYASRILFYFSLCKLCKYKSHLPCVKVKINDALMIISLSRATITQGKWDKYQQSLQNEKVSGSNISCRRCSYLKYMRFLRNIHQVLVYQQIITMCWIEFIIETAFAITDYSQSHSLLCHTLVSKVK